MSVFETAPWTGDGDGDKCIFVGKPQKLIEKYKLNTNDEG
jgi:hypothetical protein